MWEALGLVAVGLVALIVGGDLFIRGAASLAKRLGVSSLVIGLTVVGFGTSIPELVTSFEAAWMGQPELAVGNVIGSNIANILLILAVAILIAPIRIQISGMVRDCVALGVATGAGLLVLLTGALTRPTGLLFLALVITYTVVAYRSERETHEPSADLHAAEAQLAGVMSGKLWLVLLAAGGGLATILIGATLLVDGSITLAEMMGVSSAVIGLTVVAVGTSLPELVTSVIAAIRKQPELAFGNVVGSNIFNVLGILGTTALVEPLHIRHGFDWVDAAMFVATPVVLLLLAGRLTRPVGVAFLAAWVLYSASLFNHG
ncbi:MAG: calcium/sodium antiporter [Gammaproteobacteria bacterium]|nr:calcium/sodium antiporter [Gammaproteobacteria bacterium]